MLATKPTGHDVSMLEIAALAHRLWHRAHCESQRAPGECYCPRGCSVFFNFEIEVFNFGIGQELNFVEISENFHFLGKILENSRDEKNETAKT